MLPAADIPTLLQANLLRIHFQPIWSLEASQPIGYEALTRGPKGTAWEEPLALFQAAADSGFLRELECHVRNLTMNSFPLWGDLPFLFINFNPEIPCDLSVTLTSHSCLQCETCPLGSAFQQFGGQIVLELPESLMVQDLVHAGPFLSQLRSLGMAIALDDFGSKYANMDTLLRVKPDWIKLDRGLVQRVNEDPWRQSVVKQLVGLENQLGITVIAEGVESRGELDALRDLGVRFAQGFYLGRPVPHDRIGRTP